MSHTQPPARPSMLLVASVVLVGVGSAAGLTGLGLGAITAVLGIRRYVARMDVSPRQAAAERWARARTAVAAGANVWRDGRAPRQMDAMSGG